MNDLSLIHQSVSARSGVPPHPGLILLHGLGSDEKDLSAIAPMLDERIFTISVRAPCPYRWGGYTWYDIEREGWDLGSPGIETALGAISSFLDEVVDAYPIDRRQLFIGGFSMGAAMAGATLMLHPENVAGAIMASGFLPPGDPERYLSRKTSGKPIFQAHGTLDEVVPLDAAHRTRDFLRGTQVNLTYREYPIGHTISTDELSDLSLWFDSVLTWPERAQD